MFNLKWGDFVLSTKGGSVFVEKVAKDHGKNVFL